MSTNPQTVTVCVPLKFKPDNAHITIAWYSRHAPTPRQLLSLRALYGNDVVIKQDARPFHSAAVIAKRFAASQCDDLVLVAPLTLIRSLIRLNIQPLQAQMVRCPRAHPKAEVHTHHCSYRFTQFWRVTGLHLTIQRPIALN